jgi:hypothetical protein
MAVSKADIERAHAWYVSVADPQGLVDALRRFASIAAPDGR